jgi:sugar phosphate isomerase/epimerase
MGSTRESSDKASTGLVEANLPSGSDQGSLTTPLGLPIGSQTYPHRQRIKEGDFAGLCKDMAAIGIRDVEMCDLSFPEFASLGDGKQVKKILDDHGLKCPSGHFGLDGLRTRQQELIAWAQDIGMTQMGTSTLNGQMHNGSTTMDAVKKAAEEYNKIGAEAFKAGIQQFLHDEDFEMAKVEGDGRLAYTVLLELLDPQLVKMQFQMFAMRVVGNPVMYFQKYPGRFISMHVQGVDLNVPMPSEGEQDPSHRLSAGNVAVGNDSLNWAEIFEAAKVGGLKNYFLELDWNMTVESVAYLKTLNV